jgi:FAD/FMN-containing dehydrogenase
MNKIIEVNDQSAYAVVEPGVTFSELYKYCVEHKLKVWPSTASLGWGSVLGNVRHPQSLSRRVEDMLGTNTPVRL